MDTFSRQSLDQAFKRLDAHTTWTDGFLSLSVGQDEKECALNLDAALMELPLGNKREMRSLPDGKECEVLLSAINPSDYVEFYRTVFLSSKDDKEAASVSNKQQWPSAEDIIQSNTANSWKNHLAKSCSEWQGLPSIEKTIQIPVLEAQGPFVKDLFSLVEVAFRIASVNPYQSTEFKTNRTWDGLLDKVSRLCSVCHMFPSVSYQSLYESFESIQTNACQRSIFGGLGLRVAQTLDQLRRMPEQMGSRVQRRLTRVDLHGVTEPTYYAERCKDGDVLMFGYVLSKKRSEFVDESGAFFKSKFAIVSDGVSHNRSSFTGSAVWSPELRSFSMKLNLEKRDLQGQYNLKVKLRRGWS